MEFLQADLKKVLKTQQEKLLTRIRVVRQNLKQNLRQDLMQNLRKNSQSQLIDDKNQTSYLCFCRNDYLGLSSHPKVKLSLVKAVEKYGVGSCSSQVISGYSEAHQLLEEELADFLGYEKVLLLSTGYMANLAVLGVMGKFYDTIYQDKLNHASLIDGGLIYKSKLVRYPHQDYKILEKKLKNESLNNLKETNKLNILNKTEKNNRTLIITEGVFSMQGNMADLNTLFKISKDYAATLMLDDAHGIGVMGNKGRGTMEVFGLKPQDVPILVGTFGKAFGGFGAFVASSNILIDSLIQTARPFLYTTSLPAALMEAMRSSLQLIIEEPERRQKLHHLIQYFRQKAKELELKFLPSHTPIQVLLVNATAKLITLHSRLKKLGLGVGMIRPPTVPKGTDRLRIILNALHTEQDIDYLLENLSCIQKSL